VDHDGGGADHHRREGGIPGSEFDGDLFQSMLGVIGSRRGLLEDRRRLLIAVAWQVCLWLQAWTLGGIEWFLTHAAFVGRAAASFACTAEAAEKSQHGDPETDTRVEVEMKGKTIYIAYPILHLRVRFR